MPRIKIVTDSAGDLPEGFADDHDVSVVALDVRVGEHGPEELREMNPKEFWELCRHSPSLPETSAPSPGAFQSAYRDAAEKGYDAVLCVTISARLSATFQAARAGASEMGTDIPVRVVDSRFASMGEGLTVIEAVELARRSAEEPGNSADLGAEMDRLAARLGASVQRTRLYGTLDTLENLRRGGRIGNAQALLGSVLSIKPVIVVTDGAVEAESRQRTRIRSLHYLADKVRDAGPIGRLAVIHAEAADLETLLQMVRPLVRDDSLYVSYMGPVIGAHVGRGAIGVTFQLLGPDPASVRL